MHFFLAFGSADDVFGIAADELNAIMQAVPWPLNAHCELVRSGIDLGFLQAKQSGLVDVGQRGGDDCPKAGGRSSCFLEKHGRAC